MSDSQERGLTGVINFKTLFLSRNINKLNSSWSNCGENGLNKTTELGFPCAIHLIQRLVQLGVPVEIRDKKKKIRKLALAILEGCEK